MAPHPPKHLQVLTPHEKRSAAARAEEPEAPWRCSVSCWCKETSRTPVSLQEAEALGSVYRWGDAAGEAPMPATQQIRTLLSPPAEATGAVARPACGPCKEGDHDPVAGDTVASPSTPPPTPAPCAACGVCRICGPDSLWASVAGTFGACPSCGHVTCPAAKGLPVVPAPRPDAPHRDLLAPHPAPSDATGLGTRPPAVPSDAAATGLPSGGPLGPVRPAPPLD